MHVSSPQQQEQKELFANLLGRREGTIFSFFSKEDETEKQAIEKNTSNTYTTFHPWSRKNVVRICMDKKRILFGWVGGNKDYIFKTKK